MAWDTQSSNKNAKVKVKARGNKTEFLVIDHSNKGKHNHIVSDSRPGGKTKEVHGFDRGGKKKKGRTGVDLFKI